ncbi:MAG: hypothetical protein QF926_14360 [Alphaproteobacteria bacterium]|nr:hypothetical protein [Alphaproteobacteria bacterium]
MREPVAWARRHVARDFDAAPFSALRTALVRRGDQSEMHAYKLQQAAFEEYHATRAPFGGVQLTAA